MDINNVNYGKYIITIENTLGNYKDSVSIFYDTDHKHYTIVNYWNKPIKSFIPSYPEAIQKACEYLGLIFFEKIY